MRTQTPRGQPVPSRRRGAAPPDDESNPITAKPEGAEPFVPRTTSLTKLAEAAQGCRGCDLYKNATQAVLGEGPAAARVMMIGEQPGDQEDREGHPFVGPAGALLDKALAEAGIRREDVFVTNAVKHFKWEPRGKRRIHKKPRVSELKACRPWLEAEMRVVKPTLLVCLGATAATTVFGPSFKLMQNRGKVLTGAHGEQALATIHPSAVLRAPDSAGRQAAYAMLVEDLKTVRAALGRTRT